MAYRIEYAKSGRSACKGPKPCKGTLIQDGALRLGTLVDFGEYQSYSWRHWGCTTSRQIKNMKGVFESIEELSGFDDLKVLAQIKLRKGWTDGFVDPDDVPPSAGGPPTAINEASGTQQLKRKKKKTKKATSYHVDLSDSDAEVKSASKKARKSSKKATASSSKLKRNDSESERAQSTDSEDEYKPDKSRASASKRKALARTKSRKSSVKKNLADSDAEQEEVKPVFQKRGRSTAKSEEHALENLPRAPLKKTRRVSAKAKAEQPTSAKLELGVIITEENDAKPTFEADEIKDGLIPKLEQDLTGSQTSVLSSLPSSSAAPLPSSSALTTIPASSATILEASTKKNAEETNNAEDTNEEEEENIKLGLHRSARRRMA